MTKVLAWIALILISIPVTLLGSFVLSDMWRWFVVPVFVGTPPITYLQAVGLLFIAGFFKIGIEPMSIGNKDEERDRPLLFGFLRLIYQFIGCLFVWGPQLSGRSSSSDLPPRRNPDPRSEKTGGFIFLLTSSIPRVRVDET